MTAFFSRATFESGKIIKDAFHQPQRGGLRIISRAFATSFMHFPYMLDDFVYIIMYPPVKIISLVNIHVFQKLHSVCSTTLEALKIKA